MKSPTQRTLEALKKDGWVAGVVEKWVPKANIRRDFLGIIDIVALRGSETLAIQATSYSNTSARVKKIVASEALQAVRDAGWRLEVWGWHKPTTRWEVRRITI